MSTISTMFSTFSRMKNVDFQINIKKCRTIKKYEVLCGEDRCMPVEKRENQSPMSTLSTISTFVDVKKCTCFLFLCECVMMKNSEEW